MEELNIPKKRREELESTVVQLSLENSFEFPITSRITDKFLVEKNRYLFTVDYYGPLEVYDIKSGKMISRFMFHQNHYPNSIERMASDGNYIYLQIEGGEFTPNKKDVLLAKRNDSEDIDDCCEFIGKRLEDLSGESYISRYRPAKESGIIGRVDSFSIDEFLNIRPSLVWGTDFFGERNTRFLIHADMNSLNALNSEDGYVYGVYNYLSRNPYRGGSFRLKNGELLSEEIPPKGKSLGEGLLELPLHITTSPGSSIGISADLEVQNPEGLDDYREGGREHFPFEIIFNSGKPRKGEARIVGIQHRNGLLHILRGEYIQTT